MAVCLPLLQAPHEPVPQGATVADQQRAPPPSPASGATAIPPMSARGSGARHCVDDAADDAAVLLSARGAGPSRRQEHSSGGARALTVHALLRQVTAQPAGLVAQGPWWRQPRLVVRRRLSRAQ